MTDKTKKTIGVIGFSLLCSLIVIIGILALNSLSCIAKPELLKGKSMTCFEAEIFVYMEKAGLNKEKLPESTLTRGVDACFAKMRRDDCQKELNDFLDKYKYDPNKYDIQNVSLYNNAQLNFKDCLINSSK